MSDQPPANPPSLSLESFQGLVDQFGENSAHWPEDRRAGALALLETSAEARAILAETVRIRTLLKRQPVQAPDRLLRAINDSLNSEAQPDMQRTTRARALS